MGFLLPPCHHLRQLLAVLPEDRDPGLVGASCPRAPFLPPASAEGHRDPDRSPRDPLASDPAVTGSIDLLACLLGIRAPLEPSDPELERLLTPDVSLWSPHLCAHSRAELLDVLLDTDDALEQTTLTVDTLDVVPPRVYVQWSLTGIFANPCLLGDDVLIEPTGTTVSVAGILVTRIDGGRIRDLRCYVDDLTLLEQLTADPPAPPDHGRR